MEFAMLFDLFIVAAFVFLVTAIGVMIFVAADVAAYLAVRTKEAAVRLVLLLGELKRLDKVSPADTKETDRCAD